MKILLICAVTVLGLTGCKNKKASRTAQPRALKTTGAIPSPSASPTLAPAASPAPSPAPIPTPSGLNSHVDSVKSSEAATIPSSGPSIGSSAKDGITTSTTLGDSGTASTSSSQSVEASIAARLKANRNSSDNSSGSGSRNEQSSSAANGNSTITSETSQGRAELNTDKGKADKPELIVFDFEHTQDFEAIIDSNFGPTSFQHLTNPKIPTGLENTDMKYEIEGAFPKISITLKRKGEKLIEAKDLALSPTTPLKARIGDYNLLLLCLGDQCQSIFLTSYKVEKGVLSESYPQFFKWSGHDYDPAAVMELATYKKHLEQENGKNAAARSNRKSPVPPQIHPISLLEASGESVLQKVSDIIKKKQENDKLIYTDQMFRKVRGGIVLPRFEMAGSDMKFRIKVEYISSENRQPIEIQGNLEKEKAQVAEQDGLKIQVEPIQEKIFLFLYQQDKFQTTNQETQKVLQAQICAVHEHKGLAYNHCQMILPDQESSKSK